MPVTLGAGVKPLVTVDSNGNTSCNPWHRRSNLPCATRRFVHRRFDSENKSTSTISSNLSNTKWMFLTVPTTSQGKEKHSRNCPNVLAEGGSKGSKHHAYRKRRRIRTDHRSRCRDVVTIDKEISKSRYKHRPRNRQMEVAKSKPASPPTTTTMMDAGHPRNARIALLIASHLYRPRGLSDAP